MKAPVRLFKLQLVACIALSLAACATHTRSLSPDQIQSLRYTDTIVVFAPDAALWWGDGERAYAASKGASADQAETLAKTPEGQAYMRGQITSKMKAAMARHLAGKLIGERPVRVEVVIKNVTIASAAQRIILGGSHLMQGDVNLIDARSGAVLQTFVGQLSTAAAGQGIVQVAVENMIATADPIDRLFDNFTEQYRRWLVGS